MRAFAEEYVKNGYNGAKAYRDAYDNDKKSVCASEAYKLLRDTRIQDEIERVEGSFRLIGLKEGVNKKTIVKVLAEMIKATKEGKRGDVPDYTARKDAITLFAKLTGDFKERKELTVKGDESAIDPTKMTKEELAKAEKEILDEL